MDADDLFARLEAEIDRVEAQAGLDPAVLLELPDDIRRLVQTIARRPDLTAAELAAATGLAAADLPDLLGGLEAKGLVTTHADSAAGGGEPRYRVAFGRRRTRELPIDLWSLLDDRTRG